MHRFLRLLAELMLIGCSEETYKGIEAPCLSQDVLSGLWNHVQCSRVALMELNSGERS